MPSKRPSAKRNSTSRKRLRVLVTAGPTREFFDPVRFLSNPSSGKMGCALAEEAARRGMRVTLVLGPTSLGSTLEDRGWKKRLRASSFERKVFIPVISALDMYRAVLREARHADLVLMCAAVSDWRPEERLTHKLKKSGQSLTVRFTANPDILKELGKRKRRGQTLVGFAAETKNLLGYARRKLIEKNLDAIIANPVGGKRGGFESDHNRVVVLMKDGRAIKIGSMSKTRLASKIIGLLSQ